MSKIKKSQTQKDESVRNNLQEKEKENYGKLLSTTEGLDSILLKKSEIFSIGRDQTLTLSFPKNNRISGKHCTIEWVEEEETNYGLKKYKVIIKDFSSNGTYVNNQRVGKNKEIELFHSDRISLSAPQGTKSKQPKPVCEFVFQDWSVIPPENMNKGIYKEYEIKHLLGTGNFAEVKYGINKKTKEKYAIKIIDKKKFIGPQDYVGRNRLMDEVKILTRIRHQNLVYLEEIFEDENYLYLVLEL
ncbi:serine/threonine-protein kinase fhke-related [Anaeramoeba flamelloides]|uniref:Serine/threonine-protein kinase fhke-related n=1 Tax=Anaeramoeba flamelloides TaxID=1746091 RepID=A0ABQ8ZFK8_9EUKA|nr:serine/threonine-protein kinase fhke-related [Anaeramoeba flamelloides]